MLPARPDLRIDPAAPDLAGALLAVVRALVPGWEDAPGAEIQPVGGGITNLLYRVGSPGCPPALVRVYGRNTELVIDRARELRLFERLAGLGFAPPLYGAFANGRVEGFLPGFRALEPAELGAPGLRRRIAQRLRELHAIPPESPVAGLWDTLERWMGVARGLSFTDERQGILESLNLDLRAEQLRAFRRTFEARYAASPACRVVLAHNDLLAGNVLLHPVTGELRFIDYEYSGSSYAAFDLANHFCEYAGFDSDFERHFPPDAVRADFIDAYLGPGATADARAEMAEAVRFFVLPDHLFWGSWAVVQARYSPIPFDFIGYARLRMAGLDLHLRTLGVALG